MTYSEFLEYVREMVGNYCTDKYWVRVYGELEDKSYEHIKSILSVLAINAIATDKTSKAG